MNDSKTNSKYKTIGEVAKILNIINKKNGLPSTHTIRFWEKEFKQIKPKILSGNRRYYDKSNIDLLKTFHQNEYCGRLAENLLENLKKNQQLQHYNFFLVVK